MVSIQPINPPGGSFPGISTAVRLRGELVILSGHVPTDAAGQPVQGGFRDQVKAVFDSLGRTLQAAGLDFKSVGRLTYYVVNFEPGMLDVIKEVRSGYLSAEAPPASALISVSALFDPAVLIEVDGFAVAPAP